MRALFIYVFAVLGFLGSIATVVGVVQHYGDFTLSGVPLAIYQEYAFVRDQIFSVVSLLLLSWWSNMTIPNIVKDFVSCYFFFGLAYNRTIAMSDFWVPRIVRLVYGINVRFGEQVAPTPMRDILRSIYGVIAWPMSVWRWIWRTGEWGKQQDWAPSLTEETKALIVKAQKGHDIAFLIAFPLTVFLTALGVFAYYCWNYLESATRFIPPNA
jgi:hypothetical protein